MRIIRIIAAERHDFD